MSRTMPRLADEYEAATQRAFTLASAGESARLLIAQSLSDRQPLYPARLELLYEMAFLRIFIGWESFLEQCFYRYLCGYGSPGGVTATLLQSRFRTIATAEAAVLGQRDFILWHNPAHVIKRCRGYIHNGLHEAVIASNQTRLEWFSAIRHRIAHAQEHARREFDNATIQLTAKRYLAGRPGRFLRDTDTSAVPPRRWIETLGDELTGLAHQIAP